jgi:putative transposase
MSNYRRAQTPGGSYFFTVVTYRRQALLLHPESRHILRQVIRRVRKEYPFVIDAWVLLPEHMHCIWTLPPGDSDFSKRWGIIKAQFSKAAKGLLRCKAWINASKAKHRESTVWQRRFWEHQIRDQDDFNRHVEYIYPSEPRQTRPHDPRDRLAVFHFSPLRPCRCLSRELVQR